MRLKRLSNKLERQLRSIDAEIDDTLLGSRALGRRERWALQEGFLSQKWQAWCGFCRSTLLQSAVGAITNSGTNTTSIHAARPNEELAWIASRAAAKQSYVNIQPISGSHLEPTWGDVNKIPLIATALAVSNENQIVSGILAAGTQARHLQTIRNASAHVSSKNIDDVRALAVNYRATNIVSPTDAMFWEDATMNDFAYRVWSNRLIAAASIAVL